jgi:hypothetical protein
MPLKKLFIDRDRITSLWGARSKTWQRICLANQTLAIVLNQTIIDDLAEIAVELFVEFLAWYISTHISVYYSTDFS